MNTGGKEAEFSNIQCDMGARIITFSGAITTGQADLFFSTLKVMSSSKNRKPISLWMNSQGGDAYGMFKIYDHIMNSPIPIVTVACGDVFSAAFIVFLAGDLRAMTPNSFLGFHSPSKYFIGTASETPDEAVEATKHQRDILRKMVRIVMNKTKMPERTVRDYFRYARRVDAVGALKLGLIHEIIAPPKKVIPPAWRRMIKP